MGVQKNGRDILNDSDINNPDIDGGTIDNATGTNLTLVTPALGTPASGDLQNCTLATPSVKGVATLPVLQNLLTNSQWMAMSGSTLCEAVSGAAPVTDGANAALVNNLLTNGGFDSATTGWTVEGGTSTIASVAGGKTGNCLEITRVSGASQGVLQSATTTSGKLYQFSVWVKSGTSGDEVFTVYDGASFYSGTTTSSWVQYTYMFEATGASRTLEVYKGTATAGTMLFDSVTLYEVTPGYVAADGLGPDGWTKSSANIDVWRQHSDATYTKDGSFYSLKVTTAVTSRAMNWPADNDNAEFYKKFAGRTVTAGCWAYASDASHLRLNIYDSTGNTASSYHSGTPGWEWLEVTRTVGSATTYFFLNIDFTATGATAYFSQPMLVFGSSIGSGNFAPIGNEQILGRANMALTGYTATTSAVDAIINLEAASSGMIGKGAKAVLVKAYGKDSAAGDGVGFDVQSASGVEDGISVDTQVNNLRVQGQGWVKCDANGDIYFDHRGSGSAALTIDIKVIGIET